MLQVYLKLHLAAKQTQHHQFQQHTSCAPHAKMTTGSCMGALLGTPHSSKSL